jgi:nucleoid-associated protein YgaU
MALSRYTFSKRVTVDGNSLITQSKVSTRVHAAVSRGNLDVQDHVVEEGERLDSLAGLFYGDGSLWWVIAAASGIGWAAQVPPGTLLRIPTNLDQIYSLVV